MKMRSFLICFLLVLTSVLQAQQWEWLSQFGSITSTDYASTCTTDAQGNLYTVSRTGQSFTIDTVVINQPLSNATITKHSSNGQVLWVRQITGYGAVYATDIAVLPSGNYLISGYFMDTVMIGDTMLISAGDFDTFLANFDASGTLDWAIKGGGAGTDFSTSIDYSALDNTLVWSAHYTGTITLRDSVITSTTVYREPVLTKLDNAGHIIWYTRIAAFPPYGSVYGSCIEQSSGRIFMNANNSSTPRLFCFSTAGVQQWVLNSTGGVGILDVTCNSQGQVFMVGFYSGSSQSIGMISLPTVSGNTGFIACIGASSGGVSWVKTMTSGTVQAVRFESVEVNAAGNPVACGYFQGGPILDTTLMVTYQTSNTDGLVFSLDRNSGSLIWHRQIQGDETEEIQDVCVTGNMIFAVGRASGSVIAGPYTELPDVNSSTNVIITAFQDCTPATAHILSPASLYFCAGDSMLLQANIQSGPYVWQWQINGLDIPGGTMPYHYATASGAYAVRIGDLNGCEQTSAYKGLISMPAPVSAFTSTINGTNCNADSITLNVATFGNVSYQWVLNGNPISGATLPTFIVHQSGNYSLISTSNVNGCADASPVSTLQIGAYPTLTVNYDDSICSGTSTVLSVSGATTYAWSPPQGLSSTTSPSPTCTIFNNTTYQVIGTTALCKDTLWLPITVLSPPAAPVIALTGAYLTSLNITSGLQWTCNNVVLTGYTSAAIIPPLFGVYQAIFTDSLTGCQSYSNSIPVYNVGIEPTHQHDVFSVAPNPMTTAATISWGFNAEEATFVMMDVHGRLCYSQTAYNCTQLEVKNNGLAPGVYLGTLITGPSEVFTMRIIVSEE